MLNKIVLASNNKKKMKEMNELLAPLGIEVVSQGSLNISSAEEPFFTFIENSLAKARHAAKESGLPAIADDSGICVDALQGAPGVFSARFAGEDANDEKNNRKLLELMKTQDNKRAHYVCVLTAVRNADDPEPLIAVGRWDGEVSQERKGEGGFGYDPYFLIPALGKHAAELSAEEKNAISHRGKAMQQMKELIINNWK